MTIARPYLLNAAEGKAEDLLSALTALSSAFKAVPGFESVVLLRDIDKPHCFLLIENWASAEAFQGARNYLPKELTEPVGNALAEPPQGGYFEYQQVG